MSKVSRILAYVSLAAISLVAVGSATVADAAVVYSDSIVLGGGGPSQPGVFEGYILDKILSRPGTYTLSVMSNATIAGGFLSYRVGGGGFDLLERACDELICYGDQLTDIVGKGSFSTLFNIDNWPLDGFYNEGVEADFLFDSQSSGEPFTLTIATVPEPGTWAMMVLGIGAMGWALRRQRRTSVATLT